MPTDPLAAIDQLPREHLPAALARIAARLAEPLPTSAAADLLTVEETARLLKTGARFIYRHAAVLGAVRLSARKIRFKRSAVERYLKSRTS